MKLTRLIIVFILISVVNLTGAIRKTLINFEFAKIDYSGKSPEIKPYVDITFKLYKSFCPKTVKTFLNVVNSGYYTLKKKNHSFYGYKYTLRKNKLITFLNAKFSFVKSGKKLLYKFMKIRKAFWSIDVEKGRKIPIMKGTLMLDIKRKNFIYFSGGKIRRNSNFAVIGRIVPSNMKKFNSLINIKTKIQPWRGHNALREFIV